jgi:hypothetical protein
VICRTLSGYRNEIGVRIAPVGCERFYDNGGKKFSKKANGDRACLQAIRLA